MKKTLTLILALAITATAHGINIDTVLVGNPGNPNHNNGNGGNHGAVSHWYRISTYEVSNAQYVEFLNLVDPSGGNSLSLYHDSMTTEMRGGIVFDSGAANGLKYSAKSGRANNPVVFVSWYDSVRFANWLHNGATAGANTEDGAYALGTLGPGGVPINGAGITRKPGAQWFLPTYDEWYKAAFHKNNGATADYWTYPTKANSVPFSDEPPGDDAPNQSNTVNFYKADSFSNGYDDGFAASGATSLLPNVNYLTDVGAYTQSIGPYGTFDQGGNVFEWIEALIFGSNRGLQGGSWTKPHHFMSEADIHESGTFQNYDVGIRVANVPEPSTGLLLLIASALRAFRICRRDRA